MKTPSRDLSLSDLHQGSNTLSTLLLVCSNFSEFREVLVTLKCLMALVWRNRSEVERPIHSSLYTLASPHSAPFIIFFSPLPRMPVLLPSSDCLLIDDSGGYNHPRLSLYLTCVKRLYFGSVGKILSSCPVYPV